MRPNSPSSGRASHSSEQVIAESLRRFASTRAPSHFVQLFQLVAELLTNTARRATGDQALAEGAVQATLIDLWTQPQHYDPAQPAVPWLISIVRSKALMVAREYARVPDPDRLRGRLTGTDPSIDVQRSEQHALVREALNGVPDRYRQTLTLHILASHDAGQIAEQVDQPIGTVKTRIRRGLTQLRYDLRRALRAAAVLVGIRLNTVERRPAIANHRVHSALWLILGTVAVMTAAALWLPPSSRSPFAIRPVSSLAHPPQSIGEKTATKATRTPASPDSRAVGLRIRVQWSERQPTPGIWLRARPEFGADPSLRERTARTDERGIARFGTPPAGPWKLHSDRENAGELSVGVHQTSPEVVYRLQPGAEVTGRVVDEQDRAVAGAEVWLSLAATFDDGRIGATTDEAGRFRIRDVQPQHALSARAVGRCLGPIVVLDADGAPSTSLQLRTGRPSRLPQGSVVGAHGRPVANATLLFGAPLPS